MHKDKQVDPSTISMSTSKGTCCFLAVSLLMSEFLLLNNLPIDAQLLENVFELSGHKRRIFLMPPPLLLFTLLSLRLCCCCCWCLNLAHFLYVETVFH